VSPYLGYHFGVRVVHVPAVLMNKYQHLIYLPGPAFGLIVLTGLVGIIIPSRRSWPAILLWVSAIVIMLLPTAEHEYTYRYVIPAVPLVCIAAALAFRKPDRKAAAATATGGALAASGAAPDAPAASSAPGTSSAPAGTPGPAASTAPAASAAPAGSAAPADGPAAPAAPGEPPAEAGPASETGPASEGGPQNA
jgi:hypothetical protein